MSIRPVQDANPVTSAQLATVFEVAESTIRVWAKRWDIPRTRCGGYDYQQFKAKLMARDTPNRRACRINTTSV